MAAARLRAAWSRSITARQPGLRLARCLTMQAVILWTFGTSWPHSRKASPVHICCASDAKAGPGLTASAVAAQAMAKRSAVLLVRWKVIDAFPMVARGAGRCSSGALHAACAAARVIRHAGVTRCGCSISVDVRIKSAASPCVNYELMLRSCNARANTSHDCCVRATSSEAQMRDNLVLTRRFCEVDGFRRRSRCGSSRLRPRARSNSPPGDAFNGVCGARSKTCFPPRHILRAATPGVPCCGAPVRDS